MSVRRLNSRLVQCGIAYLQADDAISEHVNTGISARTRRIGVLGKARIWQAGESSHLSDACHGLPRDRFGNVIAWCDRRAGDQRYPGSRRAGVLVSLTTSATLMTAAVSEHEARRHSLVGAGHAQKGTKARLDAGAQDGRARHTVRAQSGPCRCGLGDIATATAKEDCDAAYVPRPSAAWQGCYMQQNPSDPGSAMDQLHQGN